jgi:hypothetical protein
MQNDGPGRVRSALGHVLFPAESIFPGRPLMSFEVLPFLRKRCAFAFRQCLREMVAVAPQPAHFESVARNGLTKYEHGVEEFLRVEQIPRDGHGDGLIDLILGAIACSSSTTVEPLYANAYLEVRLSATARIRSIAFKASVI